MSHQNELIESLVGNGYNAVLVFPGDSVGTNKILGELEDNGIPTAALAGCVEQPTQTRFCFGTDTGHSAYLGTKELIKALGGKGKIAHFTGISDPYEPPEHAELVLDTSKVAPAECCREILCYLYDSGLVERPSESP